MAAEIESVDELLLTEVIFEVDIGSLVFVATKISLQICLSERSKQPWIRLGYYYYKSNMMTLKSSLIPRGLFVYYHGPNNSDNNHNILAFFQGVFNDLTPAQVK